VPHAFDLPVLVLTSRLQSGHYVAEALHFPEVERLAGKPPLPPLLGSLKQFIPVFPRLELHRRLPPANWEVRELAVTVPPPKASPAWTEPVLLRLFALESPDGLYLPPLGLLIPPDADPGVHVRSCLARNGWNTSLGELLPLGAIAELKAHLEVVAVSLPTLKEQNAQSGPAESQLARLTTALGGRSKQKAVGMERPLARLAEVLSAPEGCRNVLLVGPSGVGKTALVYELARQQRNWSFHETSGARLIAGAAGFGGWQERCQQLVTEWSQAKAIMHLGNLVELFEVGRHRTQPYGMAGFLRGPLLRGQVQAIAECTPEQQTYLEKEFPQLLEAFSVIRLEPPSRAETWTILKTVFPKHDPDQVLDLHERFAPHAASPGWELNWLERARGRELLPTFAAQTGLPLVYLDPDLPLDPEGVLHWFQQRLHGQPLAVERLVERLAAFKSALNRPGRPLASLLLLGPTGVGKTELARLLAEHLYGHRAKLTRFDMSEYSDPIAVQRLVGIPGVEASGQLILKVRESPFQVLLFDELEKAHPDFFDLLLQLLDEGRLTDAAGNLADFTSTLVLMTTNLGAESLQKAPAGLRQKGAGEGFLEAVRASFRPELLNRIDEVLPFSPLTPEIIRALAEREVAAARRRPGLESRSVAWKVEPELVERLAQLGYDPRYGARPLQRTVERELLLPLARELNQYPEDVPLEITAGSKLVVTPVLDGDEARRQAGLRESLSKEVTAIRQRLTRFMRGPLVVGLLNERARGKNKTHFPMQKWLDGLEALRHRVLELEEEALLALDRQIPFDEDRLNQGCREAWDDLQERILHLFARTFTPPDRITLALVAPSSLPLLWLGRGYHKLADELGWELEVQTLAVKGGVTALPTEDNPTPQLDRVPQENLGRLWLSPPSQLVGVLLRFHGPRCAARLCQEAGLHLFQRGELSWRLHARLSSDPLTSGDPQAPFKRPAYQVAEPIYRKHAVEQLVQGDPDRRYLLERGTAKALGTKGTVEVGRENDLDLGRLTELVMRWAAERAAFPA